MKTAVEWLTEKLRIEFGFAFSNNILEQAKEMEKERMCKFAFNYQDEFFNNGKVPPIEQYYNETFKQ